MATDLEPVAVNPQTGETIDLPNAPHESLVEALLILQDHERRAKEWRTAVEDELVRRHGDRKAAEVVGSWEVDVDRGWSREWDARELREVAASLVVTGTLPVTSIHDLVKTEYKVDGRKAQTLLNRLEGDALKDVRDCFQWKQKGRAKVRVTPVAELDA